MDCNDGNYINGHYYLFRTMQLMLVIAEMVSFVGKGSHNLLSVLKVLNVQTIQQAMAGKCSTYYWL